MESEFKKELKLIITKMEISERIKRSPCILMILMTILGGLFFEGVGAISGGIIGFLLDITIGVTTTPGGSNK